MSLLEILTTTAVARSRITLISGTSTCSRTDRTMRSWIRESLTTLFASRTSLRWLKLSSRLCNSCSHRRSSMLRCWRITMVAASRSSVFRWRTSRVALPNPSMAPCLSGFRTSRCSSMTRSRGQNFSHQVRGSQCHRWLAAGSATARRLWSAKRRGSTPKVVPTS